MEPAQELISRQLSRPLFVGGTAHASVHGRPVSATFYRPLRSFYDDICAALRFLDLNGLVSLTDSAEGEKFVVGSGLGLTGRFTANLCYTRLRNLMFGDITAVDPDTSSIPNIVLLSTTNGQPETVMVGELKTLWTVNLERFPPSLANSKVGATCLIGRFPYPAVCAKLTVSQGKR